VLGTPIDAIVRTLVNHTGTLQQNIYVFRVFR